MNITRGPLDVADDLGLSACDNDCDLMQEAAGVIRHQQELLAQCADIESQLSRQRDRLLRAAARAVEVRGSAALDQLNTAYDQTVMEMLAR